MKRKTYLAPILVAGIPMLTRQTENLIEAYQRLQRECDHAKRDPKGTCYRCGHREGR